jgi:hypothetical protein
MTVPTRSGRVVTIAPDCTAKEMPGLDLARRRIGLAAAADGTLYTAWFEKHGDIRRGGVARIEAGGQETTIMEDLQKPVGLLVVGDALLVADQRMGKVLRSPLAQPSSADLLVAIEEPDLLAHGPDGSFLTGAKTGQVRRIDSNGTITVVATGFSAVRGIAYAATNRRLFVAEHDTDDSDGVAHPIHIRPL